MRAQLEGELISSSIPDEMDLLYHFEIQGRYLTYRAIYGWDRYFVTIPFTEERQWDEVGNFRYIQTL